MEGRKVDCGQFEDKIKEIWKAQGFKVKDIKSCQVYYKPTEETVYYVINGTESGSFMLK